MPHRIFYYLEKVKMMWYIIKKKTDKRWTAYELGEKPELKRGYEMKGPYKNLIESLMAANDTPIKTTNEEYCRRDVLSDFDWWESEDDHTPQICSICGENDCKCDEPSYLYDLLECN